MQTDTLISLRDRLSRLTPLRRAPAIERAPVTVGVAAIDQVLGGGLMRGSVHEPP
jgi:hypothetical protein